MRILIKNGHIIDPSQGIDRVGDILIEDGKIKEVRIQNTPSPSDNPPSPPFSKGGEGGI